MPRTIEVPPTTGMRSLHALADALIERPDPAIDDALNAAAACFVRHGLTHTSVRDIALELGVSKATVYRQLGSVDDVVRVLVAREVHRLVNVAVEAAGDAKGGAAALAVITASATFICEHPVIRKIVTDEPQLLADLMTTAAVLIQTITDVLAAVIGDLRPVAPRNASPAPLVAQVAVRLVLSAIVLPPPDLDGLLRDGLAPHLGA
jgi:AcrR family transcriptional regulator